MAALGLSEEDAERLASTSAAVPNGSLTDAAEPSTAEITGEQPAAVDATHSVAADAASSEPQPARDGHDDSGPSLLDGFDALDPNYWDEPTARSPNSSRHSARPNQRTAEQKAPTEATGRSGASLAQAPSAEREQEPQRGADSRDDGSEDGASMGLFDEDAGVQWDAPPTAKTPAKAAPQRSGGKAFKGGIWPSGRVLLLES